MQLIDNKIKTLYILTKKRMKKKKEKKGEKREENCNRIKEKLFNYRCNEFENLNIQTKRILQP